MCDAVSFFLLFLIIVSFSLFYFIIICHWLEWKMPHFSSVCDFWSSIQTGKNYRALSKGTDSTDFRLIAKRKLFMVPTFNIIVYGRIDKEDFEHAVEQAAAFCEEI